MLTRTLSRIPADTLIGRFLRLPLRLLPAQAVVSVKSGINQGMKWVVSSSIHGCWLGHYEHDQQQLVRRLIQPGMKVLDVGANAGFYTLAFSRLVGSTGHVWAFEPFAENASNLRRHLELNGISNVTLIQAAVADKGGMTSFRAGLNNSMGAIADGGGDYLVPAVALDELLDSGLIPVPDVIKMDVEGAESRVLEGARGMLTQKKTSLLIALHGAEQWRACRSLLKEAGYDVFSLNGEPIPHGAAVPEEIHALPAN